MNIISSKHPRPYTARPTNKPKLLRQNPIDTVSFSGIQHTPSDELTNALQNEDIKQFNKLKKTLDQSNIVLSLQDMDFSGKNLLGVNLRNADLRGSTFKNTNLTRADLRGVTTQTRKPNQTEKLFINHLQSFSFKDSNASILSLNKTLRRTDFKGATLDGAQFDNMAVTHTNPF